MSQSWQTIQQTKALEENLLAAELAHNSTGLTGRSSQAEGVEHALEEGTSQRQRG